MPRGHRVVGSCRIPPRHFLSRRISPRMLEFTGAVHVRVDLQLTQECSGHLTHSGHAAVPLIPRAFLRWERSSSGTP